AGRVRAGDVRRLRRLERALRRARRGREAGGRGGGARGLAPRVRRRGGRAARGGLRTGWSRAGAGRGRGRRSLSRACRADPTVARPVIDSTVEFALFDTAIGCCTIAWSARGVAAVRLPEDSPAASRARLRRRFPDAREAPPPPAVQRVIEGIVASLAGEPRPLDDVTLDMEGVPPFHRRVYEVARTIPWGATASYGDIARRLGDPAAAR